MKARTSETIEDATRAGANPPGSGPAFRIVRGGNPGAVEPDEVEEVSSSSERRVARPAPRPLSWRIVLARTTGGLASIVTLLVVWWMVAVVGSYPTFILPTPLEVAAKLANMLADGSYFGNLWTTVVEAGLGFIAAFVVGTTLGYFIGHSHFLEKVLSPYIAITQGLPVVAIAPLLAIWVRNDLAEKILVVALIVFFPILVNTIVAVRGIDRSMYEVALISGANRLQTFRYVELPLGLRSLLGGVKLGLTLAITGAVIGEFISAGSGLGFLMTLGRGVFDTPLVFVGLVSLATLTIIAYSLVTVLEKALINWE